MNPVKLQKKRQRKEAKRNLKRKVVRCLKNKWNDLGRSRQTLAQERARRSLGIKVALANLDATVKKWNDKIPLETLAKLEELKDNLKVALKTKNVAIIDKAIKDFGPVNQEVNDIIAKVDAPVV